MTPGRGRLPKIQKKRNELLVAANDHERQELVQLVSRSYLPVHNNDLWHFIDVHLVHNDKLAEQFRHRKAAMRQEVGPGTHRGPRDRVECYAFLVPVELEAACRDGVSVQPTGYNWLGNSLMGVYLFRHADVCLEASRFRLTSRIKDTDVLTLLVCKVVLGRVKTVPLNDGGLPYEPTPNYHCHVLDKVARPTDVAAEAQRRSQVYIYEYNDLGNPSSRPRQCLPYATVSFRRSLAFSVAICQMNYGDSRSSSRKVISVRATVKCNTSTPESDRNQKQCPTTDAQERSCKRGGRSAFAHVTSPGTDTLVLQRSRIQGSDAPQESDAPQRSGTQGSEITQRAAIPKDSDAVQHAALPKDSDVTQHASIPQGSDVTQYFDTTLYCGVQQRSGIRRVSGMPQGSNVAHRSSILEGCNILQPPSILNGSIPHDTDVPHVFSVLDYYGTPEEQQGCGMAQDSSLLKSSVEPQFFGILLDPRIYHDTGVPHGYDELHGSSITQNSSVLHGSGEPQVSGIPHDPRIHHGTGVPHGSIITKGSNNTMINDVRDTSLCSGKNARRLTPVDLPCAEPGRSSSAAVKKMSSITSQDCDDKPHRSFQTKPYDSIVSRPSTVVDVPLVVGAYPSAHSALRHAAGCLLTDSARLFTVRVPRLPDSFVDWSEVMATRPDPLAWITKHITPRPSLDQHFSNISTAQHCSSSEHVSPSPSPNMTYMTRATSRVRTEARSLQGRSASGIMDKRWTKAMTTDQNVPTCASPLPVATTQSVVVATSRSSSAPTSSRKTMMSAVYAKTTVRDKVVLARETNELIAYEKTSPAALASTTLAAVATTTTEIATTTAAVATTTTAIATTTAAVATTTTAIATTTAAVATLTTAIATTTAAVATLTTAVATTTTAVATTTLAVATPTAIATTNTNICYLHCMLPSSRGGDTEVSPDNEHHSIEAMRVERSLPGDQPLLDGRSQKPATQSSSNISSSSVMSALPASTELLKPAGFRLLDRNVCRSYAKYLRAYSCWLQQRANDERLALLIAMLRVEIEYYVALYQAAVDLDQVTDLDMSEPRPLSTWQHNELSAVDAHLRALRLAPVRPARATALTTRLRSYRAEVRAQSLVPELPASCPGNNLYCLLKLLREGCRRPTKASYLKKKIAALLNLDDTSDGLSRDT